MLHYGFMQHALLAACAVSVLCGLVGWFLLLRAEAFAGHALSHVGFTGATGAVLLGFKPLAGLMGATLVAGLAMGGMGARLGRRDVAIGMVLSLALGLGLLFLHFYTAYAAQATALLFGNVLAVDRATVAALCGLCLVSLAGLALIGRPVLFAAIHPEIAAASGLSPRAVGMAFLAIAAIAIAGAAEIVGVLLVFTLLIGPAASAQALSRRISSGLVLAPLLGLGQAWAGLTAGFYSGWPVSFWIAAFSFLTYVLATMVRPAER